MVSYWFPAPVAAWLPLTLTIGFGALAVIAVVMTLARQQEERDAGLIATFYGIGLGLAAVSELLMYFDVVYGWSFAVAFAMSASFVTFIAVAAVVIAFGALCIAAAMQIQEEGAYHSTHGLVH
ncbi:MAG TPA: hypothetical protein VFQ32_13820 [Ktedonobacterales bacterium]|nr:hypothetical protein [Ktedonobacterales bacterium]